MVFSGGGPTFSVLYDGYDWDAALSYPGAERVYFGQTVTAYIAFLNSQCHAGRLYPEKEFLIRKGTNTVGRGRVIRILNLEKRAEELVAKDPSVIDGYIRK